MADQAPFQAEPANRVERRPACCTQLFISCRECGGKGGEWASSETGCARETEPPLAQAPIASAWNQVYVVIVQESGKKTFRPKGWVHEPSRFSEISYRCFSGTRVLEGGVRVCARRFFRHLAHV